MPRSQACLPPAPLSTIEMKSPTIAARLRASAAILLVAICPLGFAAEAPAQGSASTSCNPPFGYYSSIDTSSAARLRATLHARIDDHRRVPWSGTWAVLESADQDPQNASRVRDVYKNASYPKYGRGNNDYNREHTWPKSLGYASSSSRNYPESDCHALFLCNVTYNSVRANKMFRNLERTAAEYRTDGGSFAQHPGTSCWTDGFGVTGAWEPWMGKRGDVARALLYLDVRYDGSRHQNGSSEPDLVLTDDVSRIRASQSSSNLSVAYMGLLSVLLQWHQQDPPDAAECRRNGVVYAAQGNRNPFIDHPEWAYRLFAPEGTDQRTPWINEFHYDNSGSDQGEMVEIAGPAGMRLDGWRVLAYNGNGGGVYDDIFLRGVLPASSGCTGVLSFGFDGLQNGPRDALALVDPRNRVVEFLSYEGALRATDGAAVDMNSVDIGVFESSTTPVGNSLQLTGTGTLGADFAWRVPTPNTRSASNVGQTFTSGCGRAEVYGCGLNPAASMRMPRGIPSIGLSFDVAVDNPVGSQMGPSALVLAIAGAPISFPCGLPVPGFGMRPGTNGEFLIGANALILAGPTWNGAAAVMTLRIPDDRGLVGAAVYAQGAIIDPRATNGVLIGLTDGLRIRVGL